MTNLSHFFAINDRLAMRTLKIYNSFYCMYILYTSHNTRVYVTEELSTSPRSSVCSSVPNSVREDEVDDVDMDVDLPAEPKLSPSSTSDCRPNERPLNLTKRKERTSVAGTSRKASPDGRVPEPAACPEHHLPCSEPSARRPSSFSLKTSPARFLGSPAEDRRRVRSKVSRNADGWSRVHLGGTLPPAFDNNHASMMMTTPPSALDRVPVDACSHFITYADTMPYTFVHKN